MEASRLARMLNEARSVAKKRTQSYSGSKFACSDPSKKELPEAAWHLRSASVAESAIHAARAARTAPPIRAKQCFQKWYILWACSSEKKHSMGLRPAADPKEIPFMSVSIACVDVSPKLCRCFSSPFAILKLLSKHR